jgi:hypothetical protein
MSSSFSLVDSLSLGDLQVFLQRAGKAETGSVRLIADSRVLAAYAAVLWPMGLLDNTPTVLGLRTFALAEPASFDKVVPNRSLLDRLDKQVAAGSSSFTLPHEVTTVTWAGISPPRGGWTRREPLDSMVLERVARRGIQEVAESVPAGTGEQLVHKARAAVWGRSLPDGSGIPSGAAFAMFTLGFLYPLDPVTVFETGTWTRLSSRRGHVLVRQRH